MKRFPILPFFAFALLATSCLVRPCRARDKMGDDAVTTPDAVSVLDPLEEARKIRRLVKLALANDAPASSKQVLQDETTTIEKNKKLRENVVTDLMQDDSLDPTLPKMELLRYKDGSLRGVLFVQTDNVRYGKPNSLEWILDSKRERKEQEKGR